MFLKKKANKFVIVSILFLSLSSLLAQNNRANEKQIIERDRQLNCEVDTCKVERSETIDCSVENCDRDSIDLNLNEAGEASLIIRNDSGESVFYDIDFRSRVPVRKFTGERLGDRYLVKYITNKRMGAVVDFDSDICQSGIQVETKMVYASNNSKHNYHSFEKIDSCTIDLRLSRS